MRKIFLTLLAIIPAFGFSQMDSTVRKAALYEGNFASLELIPKYIGGDSAREAFISKNLVYPKNALEAKKQGKVYVKFVVEADSTVSNVQSLESFDDDCAKEAERIVKMMQWAPGRLKGKAIRALLVIPIPFKIN